MAPELALVLPMKLQKTSSIVWSPADKARGRFLQKRLELNGQAAVARFCIKLVYDVLASGQTLPMYGLEPPPITAEDTEDE